MRVLRLRKLGFYVVALWAAVTLNFVIPRLMPGNPVDILLARLQQRGGAVDPAVRRAYALLLGTRRRSRSSASSICPTWAISLRGDLGISVSVLPGPGVRVILQPRCRGPSCWSASPRSCCRSCSASRSARSSAGSAAPGSTRWCPPPPCSPRCRTSGSPCSWSASSLRTGLVPAARRVRRHAARPAGTPSSSPPRSITGVLPALTIVHLLGRRLAAGHAQHDGLHHVRGLRADRAGERSARAAGDGPLRGTQRRPAVGGRFRDLAGLRGRRLDRHRAGLLLPRHRRRGCCRRCRTTTTR